ncbi:5,6-dimethylbenzimidazole synthase [Sulfuricurvum sp.]|uniref:5,6-dimethylbenzimidazole synthase n=1 Tax=Sulfuricurvum sp. TaxID=2025608 RepID=UPI003BB52AB3
MRAFDLHAQTLLQTIFSARRDVRGKHFQSTPIEDEVLRKILEAAISAPSVGFSQPWKFIIVQNVAKREAIYNEFVSENAKAAKLFDETPLYASLKLEGIKESPLNIAVLYQKPTKTVLGQTTQKKMGEYSVVCAIQNLWLMARAHNIGVGWVSILRPKKVKKILGIGDEYKLIGYLTMGYVSEFLDEPELLKLGWEEKKTLNEVVEWV